METMFMFIVKTETKKKIFDTQISRDDVEV